MAHQRYTDDLDDNQERDISTSRAARNWIEELVAEKVGVRFEVVIVEVRGAKCNGKYLPERAWEASLAGNSWRQLPLRSSYTYKGERQDENTLSIREVIVD